MSMQSWFDIGMANTPAEKEAAREKHRILQLAEPTDAQNVENFLAQCVDMDGKPFAEADIKACAARVEADIKTQQLKRGRRLFN